MHFSIDKMQCSRQKTTLSMHIMKKKTKIAVLKIQKEVKSNCIFKIETTKNSVGKVARFTPKTFR